MPNAVPAPPPAAATDKGKIKGAAFKEFVAFVEQDQGAEALGRVVAALAPDVQRQFLVGRPALGLLAATWYPSELVHAFLDQLTHGVPDAVLERMAREGAEFTMQRNLRGVYRSLFGLFVSPRIYVLGMQQLWNLHYDTGRVRNVEEGPHAHRAVIESWRGHHPFICRLNMAAVFPIYGAMKCRDIEVRRVSCVSYGDPDCSWGITWSDR
jgi:hypothetical protein